MFATLRSAPIAHSRVCQEVDAGHVHGTVHCRHPATVHCRRTGGDVCDRHESGHTSRAHCGQGEHEDIPVLVVAGSRR